MARHNISPVILSVNCRTEVQALGYRGVTISSVDLLEPDFKSCISLNSIWFVSCCCLICSCTLPNKVRISSLEAKTGADP
ncbi:hypothetical protein HanHA300_Chr04g0138141 [Helianthus annuus]|nr:hypothetical protein HanHA300_Chr04g0138141 [Helianthus annuus]KAJ0597141.1 hypothetical protein HanHA89_Chr04g0151121 [Helianthus annuus]KAJ0757822.1 hypothetical protein HanLR1_Chr04g0143211 [Helianthus annuus]